MATLLLSFLALGVALLAMSIGVLLGRPPITGSCGGLGGRCAACSGNCPSKRAETEAAESGRTT